MNDLDLVEVERQSFRAGVDTGLWDVMIAAMVSMFSIAPLLSSRLGDFWSSAVFLPVFALVFLLIRFLQARVVAPRLGTARFGQYRQRRLRRFAGVMVVVNVVALAVGVLAAVGVGSAVPWIYPVVPGLVLLLGFSLAAQVLGIPRYFFYGILLIVAPVVGEALWRQGYVSHHGYPLMFGIAAVVIAVTGLVRFQRHVLRIRPPGDVDAGGSQP